MDEIERMISELGHDDKPPESNSQVAQDNSIKSVSSVVTHEPRTIIQQPLDDSNQHNDGPKQDPIKMLVEIKNQFDQVADVITNSYQGDRHQAQTLIDLLMPPVTDGNINDVSRGHLDNLVRLVEVKANMTITMVRMLDARTRLLQAVKGGTSLIINNSNGASSDEELAKILSSDTPNNGDPD